MTDRGAEALDELRDWGNEPELNALDALMWRTESPPANSWTGVVIEILDCAPDWDRLVDAHHWAMQIVPRFKQKIVEPALPVGPPVWTLDSDFDLGYHLRRVRLPEPGSMRQLLDLAQTQAVAPLDRNRSPWVGTLVEGLEDGRAAYVLQAHHVLMDGGAATQLFERLLGTGRESRGLAAPHHDTDLPTFTSADALRADATRLVRGLPGFVGKLGGAVAGALADPVAAVRYARSMGRILAPPTAEVPEVVRGGPRISWRFGTLECQLDELKRAAKAVGGTVNDTFVAAILGGLREYFAFDGIDLPDIPISMPVSVRRGAEDMGGNRFAGAFFAAPSGIRDPAERIEAMHRRVLAVRDEPALDFLGVLTPVFNFAPSSVVGPTLRSLTTSAVVTTSSWPGLTESAYVAGARFDRMFVFGPLPGTSMCAALCSHVGTCCIGINVDGDVFSDTDRLWNALQQSLDEVLALGSS